ncbi:hypothetical protein C7M84_007046, partial [Penaeus vannamei]
TFALSLSPRPPGPPPPFPTGLSSPPPSTLPPPLAASTQLLTSVGTGDGGPYTPSPLTFTSRPAELTLRSYFICCRSRFVKANLLHGALTLATEHDPVCCACISSDLRPRSCSWSEEVRIRARDVSSAFVAATRGCPSVSSPPPEAAQGGGRRGRAAEGAHNAGEDERKARAGLGLLLLLLLQQQRHIRSDRDREGHFMTRNRPRLPPLFSLATVPPPSLVFSLATVPPPSYFLWRLCPPLPRIFLATVPPLLVFPWRLCPPSWRLCPPSLVFSLATVPPPLPSPPDLSFDGAEFISHRYIMVQARRSSISFYQLLFTELLLAPFVFGPSAEWSVAREIRREFPKGRNGGEINVNPRVMDGQHAGHFVGSRTRSR